jgi:hypothetical protein
MSKPDARIRHFVIAWLISAFPFCLYYLSENEKVVIVPTMLNALVTLSDDDDDDDEEKRRR